MAVTFSHHIGEAGGSASPVRLGFFLWFLNQHRRMILLRQFIEEYDFEGHPKNLVRLGRCATRQVMESKGMDIRPQSKIWSVLALCAGLFVLNAAWLTFLQHSDRSQLHASPFYPIYLSLRTVLLRPLSLIAIFVFTLFGLLAVSRPRKKPGNEFGRLALLAVVVCTVVGIVLLWLFKL